MQGLRQRLAASKPLSCVLCGASVAPPTHTQHKRKLVQDLQRRLETDKSLNQNQKNAMGITVGDVTSRLANPCVASPNHRISGWK